MSIWRKKLLILLLVLIGATTFYMAVSRVTPLYTARASVMLDPRSIQVLSSDSVISELNLNNPLLDTETAVLRSNLLLERVVEQIGADVLAPIDPQNQEPSIRARVTAAVKDALRQALQQVLGEESAPSEPGAAVINPEDMQMRRLVIALRRSLTVWREGQSYLISISAETPDAALSANIANTLVSEYIQRQIEDRNKVVRDATQFLSERVEDMRSAVEDAEARIEDFRGQQVAELGTSSDTVDRQLLELSTQLAIAQADLAQVRARQEQIESVIASAGIERAAELLTSPFVLSLRQQVSEASRLEAELATRFSEDFPDRIAARTELEQLRAELSREVDNILANLDNDVQVAQARSASLEVKVAELEERSSSISRANLELRQLEREADAVRSNYQNILTRLSETRSTEQLQQADARQVERAVVPGRPSSPRVMLFTVFGATLGFALGLAMTFYQSVSQAGFASTRDIERYLGVQVSSSTLKSRRLSRGGPLGMLKRAPYGAFAERMRQLRTVLLMQAPKSGLGQVVQISSAIPAEGKSSTTMSIAHLEGLANRKCVVVDFDLRRASLSKECKYASNIDLQNVLLDGAALKDALFPVKEYGFDLLSTRRPNPGLIDQVDPIRLQRVIEQLRSHYDLVLIDTPPLLLVSDGLRLAPLADQIVLLIRQSTTPKKAALQALRKLRQAGIQNVNVAMSFTDPASESDTYGAYAKYGYTS